MHLYDTVFQWYWPSMSVCSTSTNWASVESSRSPGCLPVNIGPAGSRPATSQRQKIRIITKPTFKTNGRVLESQLICMMSTILQKLIVITVTLLISFIFLQICFLWGMEIEVKTSVWNNPNHCMPISIIYKGWLVHIWWCTSSNVQL